MTMSPFDYAKACAGILGTVIVANAAQIAAKTAAGALIGNVPGAIIGGLLGVYSALDTFNPNNFGSKTASAYESGSNPGSPNRDLDNTELGKSRIGFGESNNGALDNFQDDCGSSDKAEISEIEVEVKLSNDGTKVLNATYHCRYYFAYGNGSFSNTSYGPFGGFNASSYFISGNSIQIKWTSPWGGTDTYTGTFVDAKHIAGTFYYNVGYSCGSGGNHVTLASSSLTIANVN